jgi:stage V sporulation protein G
MPSRKNPDETFRDIVHPINAQFRASLESAVIEAYTAALEAADVVEDADKVEETASV